MSQHPRHGPTHQIQVHHKSGPQFLWKRLKHVEANFHETSGHLKHWKCLKSYELQVDQQVDQTKIGCPTIRRNCQGSSESPPGRALRIPIPLHRSGHTRSTPELGNTFWVQRCGQTMAKHQENVGLTAMKLGWKICEAIDFRWFCTPHLPRGWVQLRGPIFKVFFACAD